MTVGFLTNSFTVYKEVSTMEHVDTVRNDYMTASYLMGMLSERPTENRNQDDDKLSILIVFYGVHRHSTKNANIFIVKNVFLNKYFLNENRLLFLVNLFILDVDHVNNSYIDIL